MSQVATTVFPTLDPLKHIRSHPKMYLPGGILDPMWLATRVSGDALLLGAVNAGSTRCGDWWVAWADHDWLQRDGQEIRELFDRILPFREAGVNAMRGEILLTAFAKDIV